MDLPTPARKLVRSLLHLRLPATRLHALLAWEYRVRQLAWDELERVFYFQPMFESLCRSVGPGCRLELCPDSKLPVVGNVDLELGARVRLSARSTLSGARNADPRSVIRIGDDTYVGTRGNLRAGLSIEIGRHVLVGGNALISSDPGHPLDAQRRRTSAADPGDLGRIAIEDDAWLGHNVSILGNVRVGEGAVVGSGSVVVKDVPPYALVVGNPARVVRFLDGRSAPAEVVESGGPNRMVGDAKDPFARPEAAPAPRQGEDEARP